MCFALIDCALKTKHLSTGTKMTYVVLFVEGGGGGGGGELSG